MKYNTLHIPIHWHDMNLPLHFFLSVGYRCANNNTYCSLNENRNSECVNSKKTHRFGVAYENEYHNQMEGDWKGLSLSRPYAPRRIHSIHSSIDSNWDLWIYRVLVFYFNLTSIFVPLQRKIRRRHTSFMWMWRHIMGSFDWRAHFEVAINAIRVTRIQKISRNSGDRWA